MTDFFKSQTPARFTAIESDLKLIRSEFELALLKQKQEFDAALQALDRDVEQMENALLERILLAEKTVRSDSLKEAGKPDEIQPNNGYTPWTQRKAKRVLNSADPDFAKKVLNRSARRGG
jgi:hypothetical protein